jgi:ribosomal protein S18 acetylase RimI-like enzyme
MLFEAAYWRPEQERPALEVGLARHDLVYLLTDWGREGDTALVVVVEDGELVGAVWYRFWGPEQHSYGYVAPEIPELAIAVRPVFRRRGIGHQLLEAILKTAASQGIEKISLSVEIENPALKLYLRHGFQPIQKNQGDWVMVAQTNCTEKN